MPPPWEALHIFWQYGLDLDFLFDLGIDCHIILDGAQQDFSG